MKKLIVIMLFVGVPPANSEEGMLDGNWLHEACGIDRLLCGFYIYGASDMYDVARALVKDDGDAFFKKLCVPGGVSGAQKTDVVIKYLIENPDSRHNYAGVLVYAALSEAWPCQPES